MDSVHSEFIEAEHILEEFVDREDKFKDRFVSLLTGMNSFIKAAGLEGKVAVNELALGYALLDYFEDIRRLKEFHKVNHINNIKIVAYTSYWILRRKPLQILEQEKELMYINERYIAAYILDHLSEDGDHILNRTNSGLKSFSESLFYFLKYRFLSANSLELAITAFFAGQIYQEKTEDLSGKLAKYS